MSSFDEEDVFKQELMDEEREWEENRHAFDLQQVEAMEIENEALVASIVTEWDEYWAPPESWNDYSYDQEIYDKHYEDDGSYEYSHEKDIYDKDYGDDGLYERSADWELEEIREMEAQKYEEFQNEEDRRLEATVVEFELNTAMSSCSDVRFRSQPFPEHRSFIPSADHNTNLKHLAWLQTEFDNKTKLCYELKEQLNKQRKELYDISLSYVGIPRSEAEHKKEEAAYSNGDSYLRSEYDRNFEQFATLSRTEKMLQKRHQIDDLEEKLYTAKLDRDVSGIFLDNFDAEYIFPVERRNC